MDEMLMVQVFCQILFSDVFNFNGENQPKNFGVFSCLYVFCAPFVTVYRQDMFY